MIRCPECNREYADDLAECPDCGATDRVFHCEECGEEFRESDACPFCGALRVRTPCARHPTRTARGRCVICHRALCEECRTGERRAYLCEDHAEVRIIEGWAQVYTARNDFEAQLLRDNLRAENIDAQIYSQRDRAFSVGLGELSVLRILVPVRDYDRALASIRDHMDEEGEVAFDCPKCGAPNEQGARECVSCGTSLE